MNSNTQQAYDDAKKILGLLKTANTQFITAIEKKGEAEISLDSIMAKVTAEEEGSATSKTALKEIVKGDWRVLEERAKLIRAEIEVKKAQARVTYLEKAHDLEKKRMSAEIEETKRNGYYDNSQ